MHFCTGSLVQQANGSVVIALGQTNVFISAIAAEKYTPEHNFSPYHGLSGAIFRRRKFPRRRGQMGRETVGKR
jgi:hypothetical protein